VLSWDSELALAVQAIRSIPQAGMICRKVAHSFGFPHFLFGLRVVVRLDRPSQFILSGYPREWRMRYDARGYMAIDPVLAHALNCVRPFGWNELDRGAPDLAAFFEDAAAHGLEHGFTVPIHGAHGSFSLLSMARREPLPEDPAVLNRLLRSAHWVAMHLHERMCGLVSEDGEHTVPVPKLSVRERKCLSLAAQGYSASAIGQELKISERTAVFHLSHAMEKLGAKTRQHAIALAMSLELLDVGTYPSQMNLSQKLLEMD
jgi:DNA-binding CsgD family transcriptional regulator